MGRYDLRDYDGVLAFGEVLRALYFALGPANLLWSGRDHFVPAEVSLLRSALS